MAARFWVNGGVDHLWGTIGNWSLTSGGAGGQAVPTNADDVTIDANSGHAMTIDASARVCKTLTTSAIRTITFDQQLSVSGSINLVAGQTYAGATTNKLRMITTGTWTTNGTTVPQDVEIGATTSFNCTLAGTLTLSGNLTLTNTTSTTFVGAFAIVGVNCTVSGTQTVNLVNDFTFSGTLILSDATVLNGVFNWNIGGLTTTGATTGTSTIVFTGTGTWTGAAGALSNPHTINTVGTLTLSGTILVLGAVTTTYTAGTVSAGTSIYSIGASRTMNTIGMTFANITITAAITLTINSLLSMSGTMTFPNAALTFAGTAGFTAPTWSNTAYTATRIVTFKEALTYTCTLRMNPINGNDSTIRHTWTSAHAATKAIIILTAGATQDLGFVDPTRIDSSLGITIVSYHATITDSINWRTEVPTASGQEAFVMNDIVTVIPFQRGLLVHENNNVSFVAEPITTDKWWVPTEQPYIVPRITVPQHFEPPLRELIPIIPLITGGVVHFRRQMQYPAYAFTLDRMPYTPIQLSQAIVTFIRQTQYQSWVNPNWPVPSDAVAYYLASFDPIVLLQASFDSVVDLIGSLESMVANNASHDMIVHRLAAFEQQQGNYGSFGQYTRE